MDDISVEVDIHYETPNAPTIDAEDILAAAKEGRSFDLENGSEDEDIGNVEALKQVQPKDLDATEIEVRIGTTWIEPEDYEQFIYGMVY